MGKNANFICVSSFLVLLSAVFLRPLGLRTAPIITKVGEQMQDKNAKNANKLLPRISGEELRAWRKQKGLKLRELARLADVNPATISAYETGRRQGMQVETFTRIVHVLEAREDALVATLEIPGFVKLPILSFTEAWHFDPLFDSLDELRQNAKETVDYPLEKLLKLTGGQPLTDAQRNALFAFRVEGNSMAPTLHDGDLLAVADSLPGSNGITLVRFPDAIAIKRWITTDDTLELRPLEPNGTSLRWHKKDLVGKSPFFWRWKVLGLLWRVNL